MMYNLTKKAKYPNMMYTILKKTIYLPKIYLYSWNTKKTDSLTKEPLFYRKLLKRY